MPVTTRIISKRGLVHYTGTGTVTLDEMLDATRETFSDASYPVPTRAFWDVSRAHLSLSPGDMAVLLQFVADNRPAGPGRVAIHVAGDLEFGLGRMFGAMANQLETSVFKTEDEALAWLMEDWC